MWTTPGPWPWKVGLPVVVKPQDGNQGKGVTVNIASRDHLEDRLQGRGRVSAP